MKNEPSTISSQHGGVGKAFVHIPVRGGPRISAAFEARIPKAAIQNVSLCGFSLLILLSRVLNFSLHSEAI